MSQLISHCNLPNMIHSMSIAMVQYTVLVAMFCTLQYHCQQHRTIAERHLNTCIKIFKFSNPFTNQLCTSNTELIELM